MNRELLDTRITVISQDLTKEQKKDLIIDIIKNWNTTKTSDKKIA